MFRSLIALWEKLFLSLEVWALKLMYLLPDGRREKLEWPVCRSFLAIVSLPDATHGGDGMDGKDCRACDGLGCV